jgi:hypothetical protein
MTKKNSSFSAGEHLSGEVVTIYAAVTNADLAEGRGPEIDHSYYINQRDAMMGTSHIGVMGGDGKVEPRTALHLGDGRYILLPNPISISENPAKIAELRKQALAKLSQAERAALLGNDS